jgi:4-hydroxybenzoate polyprenyltransferase
MPNLTQEKPTKVRVSGAVSAGKMNSFSVLFSTMRPKQWLKNVVVCAPLLFASKAHIWSDIELALAAAISFCFLSSMCYLTNDLIDRKRDQLHPVKRHRAITSGQVNTAQAIVLAITCFLCGMAVQFAIRPSLCVIGLSYVALTLIYSLILKHVNLIDVFAIAIGFVLRLVAGAVAIQLLPSAWILLCTTFGALFLALEKRRHEVHSTLGEPSQHRATLSFYSEGLLDKLQSVVTPSMVICYALYTFMSQHGQWMMLSLPFVLYAVFRYQALAHSFNLTGSPEEVFWRDRPMQAAIVLWALICMLVVYQVPLKVAKEIGRIDRFQHYGSRL